MDENNISKEISSHTNPSKLIYHTCDDNGNNLLNTEEEANAKSIHSINATNDISMKDDDNFIHKYYAPYISLKNRKYVYSRS